ncbi:serine hydrolase domain-containing protein [Williamsia sp.]|uniref:serine hydrolase domain-containing protein n=1 Tax=Williamsia sp. TaxID=1872085 RepID=UPI001A1B12C2|nr:serine hydrolase domain-containing protein [Williamsia sp.]MBJ7291133.1 beta-lactamase family protein [Williamsia sp.]
MVISAVLAVAMVPGLGVTHAAPPIGAPQAVSAYLTKVVSDQSIPGYAVAVTGADGRREFSATGGRDGNDRPVGDDTPFLIGSVAKSMTATVIAQRVARGEVRMTDRIGTHLPWLSAGEPSVEQLLTHTSGYTAADGLAVAERFDNSPGAIRRAARDLRHSGSVGRYSYSDANYLVLGALIEELSGRPFSDVLRSDVLEPLGMRHTGAAASDAASLPPGHRFWWGHPREYAPGFDESGGPFGYITSTLGDMARWAGAQSGHAPAVLDASILAELHKPRVRSGDDDYAYGWRVSRGTVAQTIQHTGATPGYFAHVLIAKDGRAVVVLMNAYSEAAAPALASVAPNLLRALDGQPTVTERGDGVLASAPWIAAVIGLFGVVVVGLAWWRPRRRGVRVCLAVGATMICGAAAAVPLLTGSTYRTVWIWVPDLAVALIITVAAWAGAAVVLIFRRWNRAD